MIIRMLILIVTTLPLTGFCEEGEISKYRSFFEHYQQLESNFDTAISNLYADEAKITAIRKFPDGVEQKMTVPGIQWKQIVVDSMEIAKKRDDRSEFSNIAVHLNAEGAKITASRYAISKCFTDHNYYMVVQSTDSGQLQIIEEFIESPSVSNCKDTSTNDLSLVLQGAAALANKQLPVMLDSDTKLEEVSAEGNTLIYHYQLVNYLASELDAAAFGDNIRPMLAQQTCSLPNLKPVLSQGGSIAYRYNDKDQVLLVELVIDQASCL